jgi:acetylcholinesterase
MWTYLTDNSATSLGVLNVPILGSFHASHATLFDYGTVPNSKNIMDTVISFVATLDPNNHGTGFPKWPDWTPAKKEMYQFVESGPEVIRDDYREAVMAYINANANSLLI